MLTRAMLRLGCALLMAASTMAAADPLAIVPPRPLAGPYPVACSNVAQDFTRLPSGEMARDYWEGIPGVGGGTRYATDLLAEPGGALIAQFTAPDVRQLYGPWRDTTLTYLMLVCYPTAESNTRADYPLPNGNFVPRMQRGNEGPILPDDSSRWPVVAFSHGYGGSPLSSDYILALAVFASHGYVVVAPFHGDQRYASLSFDDVGPALESLARFERYTAMQSTRALSISAALDVLLTHPQWRDRVDPDRIGGFGASQGGETLMLVGGAELTSSIFQDSRRVTFDPRLKAAVGYVPYFGQRILPAFGRNNQGTQGVTLPYLAIAGTEDTTAPIGPIQQGMHRLASSRAIVALVGVQHGFDAQAAGDIFTWSLEWLDALAKGDPAARARLSRMTSVEGGRAEELRLAYIAPAPAGPGERHTVEYYSAALDHYFITAEPAEIEMLDQGVVVPGWRRTGYDFNTFAPGAPRGAPTCRFYGKPGLGPNSHFFTAYAHECELVRNNPAWLFEGLAFQALTPGVDTCPEDLVVVWRLYNNGMGGQANHRYLTSYSVIGDMIGAGWVLEGPAFCTPP